MAQSKLAEKAVMKGEKLGLFHGVPFTIKSITRNIKKHKTAVEFDYSGF